ncbi:MAG: glutamate racemase [Desulfuromonadales bacterium]|nr:glutamate racemase [Desulfuromonadales bacterium]MDT8423743.1 glutamate racemase [Desulfuromonadales bacterium]
MAKRAVGVFDSGVGGLTVLKAIRQLLPQEDLIYLGDTARVPYGSKSAHRVLQYSLEAGDFLHRHGVKMLVVACNTASSVALPALVNRFHLPVVGVIEPGARRACEVSRTRKVAVIGTEGTIRSGAYQQTLKSLDEALIVCSVACPLFVPLAEEGWTTHPVTRMTAMEYLAPLCGDGVDTLVLGCTHYPLLKKTLQEVVGEKITLVDSAEETARRVAAILSANKQLRTTTGTGTTRFCVTDTPERFQRVGGVFFGAGLANVTHVELAHLDDESEITE